VNDHPDIFVTLSTFSAYSNEPLKLLKESGFSFRTNALGRRMKPDEVLELGQNSQALVAGVEPYTAETLKQLPMLLCISRCGSGIDSIDLKEAKRRNIAILNTPDQPTSAVAELALTMMLTLLRQVIRANSLMHQRQWQRVTGNLLAKKTIGVIGLGRIGRRVSVLAQAFGAKIVGFDPYPNHAWLHTHSVELLGLSELLARADIVSIHASGHIETPLHFGTREFRQMKKGSWLINVARGAMVDDVALKEALDSGWLNGAGLDVYPQEPYRGILCDDERVVLSPHQATLTYETRIAMETAAVKNAIRFLQDV